LRKRTHFWGGRPVFSGVSSTNFLMLRNSRGFTVTMENLKALGVERLAGILIGMTKESVDIKRRLRFELAANEGGDIMASEVGKRIAALRAGRSLAALMPLAKH
jgi:hypothetical protein